MFVYDIVKGTVSDYFLVSVDYELDSIAAQTLDCVHRWTEADKLRFAPQISRLKAHVRACYSLITQPADNSDVLSEPEQENEANNSVTAACPHTFRTRSLDWHVRSMRLITTCVVALQPAVRTVVRKTKPVSCSNCPIV